MIDIAFPDEPASEASVLVQELTQALRAEGAPDEAIRLIKPRPETMAGFEVLQIAEMVVGAAVIVKHLFDLWQRAHCTLRITTPRGRFDLHASEIDLSKLSEIVQPVFRDERSSRSSRS